MLTRTVLALAFAFAVIQAAPASAGPRTCGVQHVSIRQLRRHRRSLLPLSHVTARPAPHRRMMAGRAPAIIFVRSESLYAVKSLTACALVEAARPPASQRVIEQECTRWSERQFVEHHPGLLQVERIETLGEPAVDRSEKIAGLHPACPDRARAAPCSSPRAAPRILPAAGARPRAHARNMLPLSPRPAPATSTRFRRQCDGHRLRTIFPWLFPPPSLLRQCSARRRRIGRSSA